MSFRNGDKSREHRLRKARQKMRLKVRGLQTKSEAKSTAGRRPEKVIASLIYELARATPSPVFSGLFPCNSATIAW